MVGLDQTTKLWARQNLSFNEPISVVDGILNFRLLFNTGAAFSFLSGKTSFLALFSLLVAGGLVYFAIKKMATLNLFQLLFFVFVTSGAVGNLIDRMFLQRVTDFIDLLILPGDFPVFNFADVYINIALVFILIDYFLPEKTKIVNPSEEAGLS
ncbi:MAG: signal peptidase II [Candidatus Caenarcaniphilales bacterium]|nr:signal peptidase II [Candidatus Caenarcaniphilales bacterium]